MYYDPIDDINYDEYNPIAEDRLKYAMFAYDLIEELKEQTLEILSLRVVLSRYMKSEHPHFTKWELLNNIYPEILHSDKYQKFVKEFCKEQDPYEEPEYCKKEEKLITGKHVYNHPKMNLELLKK